jgi:hypothetical protein
VHHVGFVYKRILSSLHDLQTHSLTRNSHNPERDRNFLSPHWGYSSGQTKITQTTEQPSHYCILVTQGHVTHLIRFSLYFRKIYRLRNLLHFHLFIRKKNIFTHLCTTCRHVLLLGTHITQDETETSIPHTGFIQVGRPR